MIHPLNLNKAVGQWHLSNLTQLSQHPFHFSERFTKCFFLWTTINCIDLFQSEITTCSSAISSWRWSEIYTGRGNWHYLMWCFVRKRYIKHEKIIIEILKEVGYFLDNLSSVASFLWLLHRRVSTMWIIFNGFLSKFEVRKRRRDGVDLASQQGSIRAGNKNVRFKVQSFNISIVQQEKSLEN